MRIELLILRTIVIAAALSTPFACADDVQGQKPRVLEAGEETVPQSNESAQSGRVIEFEGGVDAGSDVIRAKVQANTPSSTEGPTKQGQKANQTNSVKLITGGDPSDGNAKSGRLPILD